MGKQGESDDLDSFMESVVHGTRTAPAPAVRQPYHAPVKRSSPRHAATLSVEPLNTALHSGKDIDTAPVVTPMKHSASHNKTFVIATFAMFAAAAIAAAGVWAAPRLFSVKSPFSEELRQKMGIPLFYPTQLPESFKLELGSITQPENDVVVYTISDDDNNLFNISLHEQPEGIGLDPLYEALDDVHDIETKLGTVRLGNSSEANKMANILTGHTWIIINGHPNVITDSILIEVINGLES